MKKEIVIGSDLTPIFNSIALWVMADISENSIFYILNNYMFDYRIYITKKSNEGNELKEWLLDKNNLNNESIQKLSLNYLMPYITTNDLNILMRDEKNKSFKEGYKAAQNDIRKCLGM